MGSYIESVIDDLEPCLFITSLKVKEIQKHDLSTLRILITRAISHSYKHACVCGEIGEQGPNDSW